MNYLFPVAFAWNTFTMTALMVLLGVTGHSHLAADVGIIQGAITALFFSFSANARSIILNVSSGLSVDSIFQTRVILILPLALASYLLSTLPTDADKYLIVALILRRCVEWISELHLSEMELLEKRAFARNFIVLQGLVFLMALSWLLGGLPVPLLGLFVWALAPLFMSIGFIREKLRTTETLHSSWRLMLPQFGSTMIIGITLYVFRLILLLITGKEVAGILFTSFALGGMVGSLFAQVLGPSVVLYENQNKKSFFSFQINLLLGCAVLMGMALFVCSQYAQLYNITLIYFGRPSLLWASLGASLVGGVIMVYAQLIRFRILQLYGDNNLFGPDLLINLLIIACVPYIYYILGTNALAILYMISATLAYIFYWCSEMQDIGNRKYLSFTSGKIFMTFIAVCIVLPLFFQFKSGLFTDAVMVFDSGGSLVNLPIPISVFACYLCIPLLGRYRHAYLSLSFVFIIYVAMLVASFVSAGKQANDMSAKLIFLLQFVLPMLALVLGQLYESRDKNQESLYRAFLYVVITIVPLQLISTWIHGTYFLYPKVFYFSIYQHLQYVPQIFVSAFLIALYGLWPLRRFKMLLTIYIPIMGLYTTISASMASIILFYFGVVFLFVYFCCKQGMNKGFVVAIVIAAILSLGYFHYGSNSNGYLNVGGKILSMTLQKDNLKELYESKNVATVPLADKFGNLKNIFQRIPYWRYYIEHSTGNIKQFMFGNRQRPSRQDMPSAHNYYLDLVYNYGFVAFLPLAFLMGYTVLGIYRFRGRILSMPEYLCLIIVVAFLLLVDNVVKVGLRQPYSGIFTFFIWGVLLAKIRKLNPKVIQASKLATD